MFGCSVVGSPVGRTGARPGFPAHRPRAGTLADGEARGHGTQARPGHRSAVLPVRGGRSRRRAPEPQPGQGARRRQGSPQDQEPLRGPPGAVLPRRPGAVRGQEPRHDHPGRGDRGLPASPSGPRSGAGRRRHGRGARRRRPGGGGVPPGVPAAAAVAAHPGGGAAAPRPGDRLPAEGRRRGRRGPGAGGVRRLRRHRGPPPLLLRRRRRAVRPLPHPGSGGAEGRADRVPGGIGRRPHRRPARGGSEPVRRRPRGLTAVPRVPPRSAPRRRGAGVSGDGLRPVPRHVAIVMDGNGRWAEARGEPRIYGHARGETALFDVIEGAIGLGIEWLTVYAFSTENWSRPDDEVAFLMQFNEDLLLRRREELDAMGVRIVFIGDRDDPRVSDRLRGHIADTEALTSDNRVLTLVFAFNYGARREIVEAARALAASAAAGGIDPETIDAAAIAGALYLAEMPDPDLIIRSSGELRLSNFLLWQAAYAEFAFPDTLWPDFTREHLAACVADYRRRGRRFGGVAGG
ncbi:MAG: di-trans,poly-cis-decaprenylcistransferase [Actinobacteria bacterium]|nr:di-trans,poly-cis-decaprenylcistransferase [Actinomycetota bacterium]